MTEQIPLGPVQGPLQFTISWIDEDGEVQNQSFERTMGGVDAAFDLLSEVRRGPFWRPLGKTEDSERELLDSDLVHRAAFYFGQGESKASASALLGIPSSQYADFEELWKGMVHDRKWRRDLERGLIPSEPKPELYPWPELEVDRKIATPDFQGDLNYSEIFRARSEHQIRFGKEDAWEPRYAERSQSLLAKVFWDLSWREALDGDWEFSILPEFHHLLLHSSSRLVAVTVNIFRSANTHQCLVNTYRGPLDRATFENPLSSSIIVSSPIEAASVVAALISIP